MTLIDLLKVTTNYTRVAVDANVYEHPVYGDCDDVLASLSTGQLESPIKELYYSHTYNAIYIIIEPAKETFDGGWVYKNERGDDNV